MRECLRFTVIGSLAVAMLIAQTPDARSGFLLRGEISPLPAGSGMLMIELSPNGGGPSESTPVSPDGTFEFRSAHAGLFGFRILGSGGSVVYQDTVVVNESNHFLSIRLPEPGSANRTADNTVSIHQLAHKVPPQARKAFDKGEHAKGKGNNEQAAELFRQAVAMDPQFADAFNELGAIDVGQGNLDQAAHDFQKAIDAVPEHRLALSNLTIVLAKLRRYDDAAAVARRALQVDPSSSTLKYLLAISLLSVKGDSDEVLDNLERSANEVPMAHLMAAELLVRRGKRVQAIRHIEDYLRVVPADDKHRDRAEAMLADLRS